MTAPVVDPAVPQQEGEQLLALAAQVVGCRLPGPDQVADGLMNGVRHPYPGQLARPMQPRQRDGVPPVRLDPLARPLRDQGRRDHRAIVAEVADLPAEPVACGPGLEAHVQPVIPLAELLDHPLDRRRLVLDLAKKPDLAAATTLRDRHRVLQLRDVERDESLYTHHGSPSVREARLGPPSNPRLSIARQGGPASAREHDV
jgi:hypothetical protein